MRRKLTIAALTLALMAGGAGAAFGHEGDHEQRDRGLCIAWGSGSQRGQDKKQENGRAFQDLAQRAEEAESVEDFCTH